MKRYKFAALLMAMLAFAACKKDDSGSGGDEPEDDRPTYPVTADVNPFTWIAIDDNQNTIDPDNSGYRKIPKNDKTVGIFYFLWLGCHGYDYCENHNDIRPPVDATRSPYNIPDLLKENPKDPAYGPQGAFHHWGEPYLGYYVMNDEFVIRKHAQMLTDAGVDAIFFDVTNGYHYLPVVLNLCEVYTKIRQEGNDTPQFAFLMSAATQNVFDECYKQLYGPGLYKDLWFCWDGKPLILCDADDIYSAHKSEFTFRQSWFLNNITSADTWFGNGEDKWPWGGVYPQQVGKHNGKKEETYVMPASHPTLNIGRSHNAANDTQPKTLESGKGKYFQAQFKKALQYDTPFLFFTGWNEWVAQRQVAARDNEAGFLGKLVSQGETYFVDAYNHEFSRDIEPLNGDFGDNYYYMLVDMIRKYKGTNHLPTFQTTNNISIDGSFDDWKSVDALYGDDKADVFHRNHFAWGTIGTYTNNTGRNDMVLGKVTNDGENVYFYMSTASDITSCSDPQWMQLFIRVNGETTWQGFDYVVNRKVSEKESTLERSKGGWNWEEVCKVKYKVSKNEIEIAIPMDKIGISKSSKFTVDFKWVDNAVSDGDIQTCMRDGDSAPNGRFRYRYKYSCE